MKVVRIYHGGRDPAHRARDRALLAAGIDLTLVVPTAWPGPDDIEEPGLRLLQHDVLRPGSVNGHRFARARSIAELVDRLQPDVVDLHEEPFSRVTAQVLGVLDRGQCVVSYTAQNLDKRFPPPYSGWERRALARLDGLYPCSRQAASVAVGKGFTGPVRVLPLGVGTEFVAGEQDVRSRPLNLLLVGRLVPEKGVLDAVQVLADLTRSGVDARLTVVGEGPELDPALDLARRAGVLDRLTFHGWADHATLAAHYRDAQVLLAPSRRTRTWVEQFGRMVVEAQASGCVVVGYASGSLPEVVGSAGVLVPEGAVDALAGAVRRLVEHPAEWDSLREAGLAASAAMTWDAVAAGQVELYEEALRHGRGVRRPGTQRAAAVSAYGTPATVDGADRPFALPVLRDRPALSAPLAGAADRRERRRPEPGRRSVVFLDHTALLSGGEIAMARLIEALDADVHVILAEDGPLVSRLRQAGASVEVLPLADRVQSVGRDRAGGLGGLGATVATASYAVRLARRLRELDPDVVHTNSLKSGYYGTLAARLAGVPTVWHVRDRIAADYMPERAARVTRMLLRHAPDVVVANSLATGETTGVRPRVVPDPYTATLPPSVAEDQATDALEIAMVGRIAPWKGQDVVLRALAQTPHVTARFVGAPMFGEDDYAEQLQQLTTDLGLDDRVTWVGFTDDVETHLAQVDAVVHASTIPEPFGQVVVEAMAAGRPVIATDAGGPAEIITHDHDGLLVPPGDPDALARALHTLTDPATRARLGSNALTRARDYTPEAVVRQVEEAWADAMGARGRRPVVPPPPTDDRLRVVFVDHTASLSGGEIALARLLEAVDVDAHVILAADGPLADRLRAAGATVEVLPLADHARNLTRDEAAGLGGVRVSGTSARYVLRLARRLRELDPDVVHTNSLKAGYYGTLAARLARVPAVWHVRDRIADDYLPPRTVGLTRFLLRRLPDAVVANSEATAATTGVRAAVLPSPYAATRPPAAPPSTGTAYEVAVVGRIAPWKGQDVVLRALAQTPHVTARFVGAPFFGENDYADHLKQLTTDLGLEDRVTWVGFTDDVETHLAQVDAVVHASTIPEPFGQVVVEAMAAGRPVIATDAGGPAEIITHDHDGLLVPPGDPDALAQALTTLADPATRRRLGTQAIHRAGDYTPDTVVAQIEDLWRETAARGRRRYSRPASRPAITDT